MARLGGWKRPESISVVQEVIRSSLVARHCPVQRRSSALSCARAATAKATNTARNAARANAADAAGWKGKNRVVVVVSPDMRWAKHLILLRIAPSRLRPIYSAVHWPAKLCITIYESGRGHARNRRQPKSGPSRWMTAGRAKARPAVHLFNYR